MKHFGEQEARFEPVDRRNFVGEARVKRLPMIEGAAEAVIVYLVEFEPGARTNWHRHSAPQLLLVKEGKGLVQKWGEPVREISAGEAVSIEPHEKHWHGAGPRTRMAHFAVNLNLTTEWLEAVADEQYRAS